MDNIKEAIETKVDNLLSKFSSLQRQQKINLIIIVTVGLLTVIAFFFIKSSIGKVSIDRSVIEKIQSERLLLAKEREALHADWQEIKIKITASQRTDSIVLENLQRQGDYINFINNKIKNHNNAYKKPSDYNNLSSDSLGKFFTEIK